MGRQLTKVDLAFLHRCKRDEHFEKVLPQRPNKLPLTSTARRIVKARIAMNMTSAELSQASGIHKSTISRYESGLRFPILSHLWIIAEVLKTSVEHLIGLKKYRQ